MSVWKSSIALAGLAASTIAANTNAASAFDLSGPVLRGRLAVYYIHDASRPDPMMTIDEAFDSGKARLVYADGVQIENLSDAPLLVPFGTLLRGGLQDKVVATSTIVPPHSGPRALATYCVDPFRSKARDGEDGRSLSVTPFAFPSRDAKLAMLSGVDRSARAYEIRQEGVWWSIDTLRSRLEHVTGATLNPPFATQPEAPWGSPADDQLDGRETPWRDSLPLALQDTILTRLQQEISTEFSTRQPSADDVVGVAFAIDGQWAGAELFQSHALFEQRWPTLLHSYAIESLAEGGNAATPAPDAARMKALLETAGNMDGPERMQGGMRIRDAVSAMIAEIDDGQGHLVEASFVPKADPSLAASTPEAAILQVLDQGKVGDLPIDELAEAPVLVSTASHDHWIAKPGIGWQPFPATVEFLLDTCILAFWLYIAVLTATQIWLAVLKGCHLVLIAIALITRQARRRLEALQRTAHGVLRGAKRPRVLWLSR